MTQPDNAPITQRLETGRKCLETLASIASQLENAKEGLTRSSYLSENLDELPPSLRKLWESLDKDVTSLPQRELIQELGQLERLLTVRLNTLLPLINDICDADERGSELDLGNARQQLADLARLASTALALRLLAKRRHYVVPPAELPINSATLRDRATRVKNVERRQKLAVITQIKDMMKATTEMLNTPGLDAGTGKMLKNVLRDLQSNAKHLGNGGSFATLPAPIETVEMQDDPLELDLVAEPALPKHTIHGDGVLKKSELDALHAAVPIALKPISAPVPVKAATTKQPSPPQASKRPTAPLITHPPPPAKISIGRLWRQFNIWMHAPMGATWRQADAVLRAAELKEISQQNPVNHQS